MALLVLGLLGFYAYYQRSPAPNLSAPPPKNPLDLPPINRNNPAANDLIKPPSWTYDPLRIGYNDKVTARRVKGQYPMEKHLGPENVDRSSALWKSQTTKDIFVQQQTAYSPINYFLDNTYWSKGVAPHPRIKSLGDPTYQYVKPYSTSPV